MKNNKLLKTIVLIIMFASMSFSTSATNDGPYGLKVYFHIIRTSNGTGGQSLSTIDIIKSNLNSAFNPHNIDFIYECNINYINSDYYYLLDPKITSESTFEGIYGNGTNARWHSDGIDIFLFPISNREYLAFKGQANKEKTAMFSAGTYNLNSSFINPSTTHMISHEIGHIFGLWHTFETSFGAELVDGSNSNTAGDKVIDTPASWEYTGADINESTCTLTVTAPDDANGHQYTPDLHNIMSYDYPTCMTHFTPGQGQKMRFNIANQYYLQDCIHPDANILIAMPVLWNTNKTIYGDITIWNGGELTITSTISLSENSQIIVEKGGRLILDGGTLTNLNDCNNDFIWKGVIVKGDASLSQIPSSNQGYIRLKPNSVIENAYCGILSSNQINNCQYYNSGGGIIIADNSSFYNNATDISMMRYQRYHTFPNGKIIKQRDLSSIRNCLFETTVNYTNVTHIKLWGIYKLLIYGNTFRSWVNYSTQIQAGIGIHASESSFNITDTYNNNTNDNEFSNLYYGVKSHNNISNGVSYIKGSKFENVFRSIYLHKSSSIVVLDNDIEVSDFDTNYPNFSPYGIYLNGGTGFKVEENNISCYNSSASTHGIIINNTGGIDNEIYKNTLTSLNVAIQAQDENKLTALNYDLGLRLFCNINDGSRDIWVCDDPYTAGVNGIAADQQMSVYNYSTTQNDYFPAGNQFSQGSPRQLNWDLDNTDGDPLYYYYDNNNPTYKAMPAQFPNDNVTLSPKPNSNLCASKSNSGNTSIGQLYTNSNTARIAFNSSSVLLNIWKDGGNANLEEEVETTLPWDVYVEFNSLYAESPYLSDEVLIATIQNPAFTSLMIKLLMIANPQASRNDEIMTEIYNRVPAMPQSYIDAIEAQEEISSQLELLENNVSSDYHLLRMIGEDIKRNYKNDTINDWAKDSLLAFVLRQPDLLDKYELASIYLEDGLYTEMNTSLSNIPSNFELSVQQNTDHAYFVTTFTIAQDMIENNKFMDGLSATQQNSLETILNTNRPQVSQMALSLLIRNNPDYNYEELILEPTQGAPRFAKPNESIVENTEIILKCFPNPAIDFITLEYRTTEAEYSMLHIEIYDITGKKVQSNILQGGNSEEIISLSELSKGSYTINLFADDNLLASEKISIMK